jgi:hypothetical protein
MFELNASTKIASNMKDKYSEEYYINLSLKIYDNLVSIYGETIVNKSIKELIQENEKEI